MELKNSSQKRTEKKERQRIDETIENSIKVVDSNQLHQ